MSEHPVEKEMKRIDAWQKRCNQWQARSKRNGVWIYVGCAGSIAGLIAGFDPLVYAGFTMNSIAFLYHFLHISPKWKREIESIHEKN